MKSKILSLIGILSVMFFTSCEDLLDPRSSAEIVLELEGQWMCDEESSVFKSTLLKYTVYISPSETDSNRIFISNFYQLGNGVEATALVSNYQITIPIQTLPGDYTVKGTGVIAENLKEISWTYYVDDGSGVEDEVTATYTLQY
jgi:hypothetical protein